MVDFPAELILQSLTAPVLLIDPEQRVRIQNDAMTKLLRFDFTGRNYVTALRQPGIIDAIDAANREQTRKSARYAARTEGVERDHGH